MKKTFAGLAALAVAAVLMLSGCSAAENTIDDIRRALGVTPGTFLNYGADGQVVFEAHCRSMDFAPDDAFAVKHTDDSGKTIIDVPSSVVKITCGDSQFSTVGFTSVYMSDSAKSTLFANSQQFATMKIQNNDRAVPLINFMWRSLKNNFVGTARVVQVCDQNNNPILAFAGDEVNSFASDVVKSTMFQIKDHKTGVKGYVWISRGSYTAVDTALMG
jgi:hypothetical protein